MSLASLAPKCDPFRYLPNEICLLILEQLDPLSLATVCNVSQSWSAFGSTDYLWKKTSQTEAVVYDYRQLNHNSANANVLLSD